MDCIESLEGAWKVTREETKYIKVLDAEIVNVRDGVRWIVDTINDKSRIQIIHAETCTGFEFHSSV